MRDSIFEKKMLFAVTAALVMFIKHVALFAKLCGHSSDKGDLKRKILGCMELQRLIRFL